MLGWHDSEVLGRTTRVVPTEARAEFDRQLAQIQLGRTVQEHATVRQRNDGSILDVVSSSLPLYTATGEVRGVLEIVSDRSDQCRQARQSQALLRVQQILGDSPVLDAALPAVLQTIGTHVACDRTELWVRTPADGPLQLAGTWCANASQLRTAGAAASPAAPTTSTELPEAVARARTVLFRPAAGPLGRAPQQIPGPTSAAVGIPVMDQQQVIAVLGLHGPDLHEFDPDLRQWVQSVALVVAQFLIRQRREAELAETSTRLRQSQKMDALGLLTGGIAHDFNNVLTVILSYSELAGDEIETGHPAHDMLSEIHHAGQRAAAMTRRLLSFSRRRDEGPVLIDVNHLVADLMRMLRRLIGPGVQLESRLVPGIGVVRADAGQIEQVLVNLVVNARDAMPDGGRITLSTCGVTLRSAELRRYPGARSGDYVAVTVADTGCGMEESTRARIFEPFFTTKAPGSGTGMGLATVAAIVRQCGGFIDVETAVGRGTAMHVFLPRARETLATQLVDEGPPTPPAGGTETILLIEDDPTIRTLIRRIIQVRGYHVLEAADGDEALRLLSEVPQTVSLILTSPEAARMAHAAFAHQLRAVSPATRVMLLVDSSDDRRASGSDHDPEVLQKPFTSDDLARRIRVVLDERAG
jgi:signal transduction histidine kinase